MTTANEVDNRITTHEAVCAERYAQINGRLKRIEKVIMWATASVIAAAFAILMAVAPIVLQR